ncbi:hypoxanthine phosphoribosyltransferase [bacterium]|nr:hypoxanthine phosphoribosyltransferase [bacterium]
MRIRQDSYEITRTLISEEAVQQRVKELAREIQQQKQGCSRLIMVGVLKGAFVFLSDLVRHMQIPVSIDFIQTTSYGNRTQSSGEVQIIKDIMIPIEQEEVILIEDIIDSGRTIYRLKQLLKTRMPKSLEVCALLDKPDRRQVPLAVEYTGFTIPDHFVVGYGLDVDEQYRNLPYIAVAQPTTRKGEK